jgi:hypothetical protein
MIISKSKSETPLERDPNGRHIFGGPPFHRGITPKGSSVATHRILVVDLTDPDIPFASPNLKSLPLYYPLKYGMGGGSMQYRVVDESEIEIIAMGDEEPDPDEMAYVQVTEFPDVRFRVLPPITPGSGLPFDVATFGGTVEYGTDEPCMNPKCPHHGSASNCDLLATIPPIEIEGHDDIWWEFQGACMFFHFWYCRGCDTIIAANRCT